MKVKGETEHGGLTGTEARPSTTHAQTVHSTVPWFRLYLGEQERADRVKEAAARAPEKLHRLHRLPGHVAGHLDTTTHTTMAMADIAADHTKHATQPQPTAHDPCSSRMPVLPAQEGRAGPGARAWICVERGRER